MCKSAEDHRPGGEINFSQNELDIQKHEAKLDVQDVSYDVFERCIKRFGYAVDLTDDCWRATVAETHVNIENFKEHGNVQHSFFQNKKIFDHGRYEARKVLYIAFLHCKHRQRSSQERALWGIINPQLKDSISHEEADEFFDDLALVAIDLPLKHCQSQHKAENKRERQDTTYKADPEMMERLQNQIDYLTKC